MAFCILSTSGWVCSYPIGLDKWLYQSVHLLCHVTCNIQTECFNSAYHSYTTLKFVHDVGILLTLLTKEIGVCQSSEEERLLSLLTKIINMQKH